MTQSARQLESIILAAGKGTRMGSDLAKVLHPVAGRPMVDWVIDACDAVGCRRNVLVVGHQADRVKEHLASRRNCEYVEQTQQLGTGHAVIVAESAFKDGAHGRLDDLDVLVLCGDGPLIQIKTLQDLIDAHRRSAAAATLATSVIPDPAGYGRIVRDTTGRFNRIVEHKDATEGERAIREINPSYYCFRAADLFAALKRITNDNAKGEYYLTDVLGIFVNNRKLVEVVDAVPPQDVLSINSPAQLAEVDDILKRRLGMEASR